jgi:hypothetical protein
VKKHLPSHIFSHAIEDLDINKGGLRSFYQSNYAALQVLDNFARRKKDSHISTVSSVVSRLEGGGHVILRPEVMRVFRAPERFR